MNLTGNSTKARPANERFREKYFIAPNGCWIWTGSTKPNGYGTFFPNRDHPVLAHRWSYEQANGRIPTKHVVHHECHETRCVNPDHMRALTQKDHVQLSRKVQRTHCRNGHALDETTTFVDRLGSRRCRVCDQDLQIRKATRKRDRRDAAWRALIGLAFVGLRDIDWMEKEAA